MLLNGIIYLRLVIDHHGKVRGYKPNKQFNMYVFERLNFRLVVWTSWTIKIQWNSNTHTHTSKKQWRLKTYNASLFRMKPIITYNAFQCADYGCDFALFPSSSHLLNLNHIRTFWNTSIHFAPHKNTHPILFHTPLLLFYYNNLYIQQHHSPNIIIDYNA